MQRTYFNDGLAAFLSKALIAFITVLILCGISPVVQANSPAPTESVWLEFKLPHPDIKLDGVQVWQCDRIACESPVLITADGRCERVGCLEIPDDIWGFGCEDNRCAWRMIFDSVMLRADEAGQMPYTQFAAQLSDCPADSSANEVISPLCQSLVSGPSPPIAIPDLYAHRHWQVSVIDSALSLEPVPPPIHARHDLAFLVLFGLTVVSEVAAGFVYFSRLQAKNLIQDQIQDHTQDHTQQALTSRLKTRILLTVGLVHGISYPVAWMIMDSLSPVYWENVRQGTGVLVIMAIAFAFALYPIRKLALQWFIPALLVIAALLWFVGFIALFIVMYGADTLLFNGLPYLGAVAIAEVFVIGYEAGVIAVLSRKALSFPQALRLSLFTNGVSILLGSLLLQSARLFLPL